MYNSGYNSGAVPEVRFGDWIGEGWKMFTLQWKGWVVLSLGLFVVIGLPFLGLMIAAYVGAFASMVATSTSQHPDPATAAAPLVIIYVIFFLAILLLMPLSVLLTGGMYKAAFKQLRGGQVEFSDLFSARDQFWTLLGAAIVHGFFVLLGAMLCIIPAYIVSGLLMFATPLILERKMGAFEALQASREVTQKNWLMFTLYFFLVQLIAGLGTYACYIGILATWPLLFTMTVVAYRDCFGLPGAVSFAAPVAPPGFYQQPPPGYASPNYPPPPSAYPPPPPGYPPPGSGYSPPPPGEMRPPFSAPPPAAQNSITCPGCQALLPADAVFCANCGASVKR